MIYAFFSQENIVLSLLDKKNCVISLGGGSILSDLTRKAIFTNSFSIYLKVDIEILYERLKKSKRFFATHGKKAIFFGRFLMGLRAPLFLVAGITKFPFKIFFLMDLVAAVISVPILFSLSFYFGSHIEYALDILSSLQKIFFLIGFIIFFYIFWKGFKLIKRKNTK